MIFTHHKSITTSIKIPGFHRWPDAPDVVAFLRETHRHIFKIWISVYVDHDERQLEFFLVQEELRAIVVKLWPGDAHGTLFGPASCETIATKIGEEFLRRHDGLGCAQVEVFEDDESSSSVSVYVDPDYQAPT